VYSLSRVFSLAHQTVWGVRPRNDQARRRGWLYAVGIRHPLGLPDEHKYDVAHDRELFDLTRRLWPIRIFINDIELARITDGVDIPPTSSFRSRADWARDGVSSIWVPDRSYYIDKFASSSTWAGNTGSR
jgi:hypothetical protein